MKDEFDTATAELELKAKAPRGRPGKVVTDSNFDEVLRYFGKKKFLDGRMQAGIRTIQLQAPVAKKNSSYLTKRIKEQEAYIQTLYQKRQSFADDPFSVTPRDTFYKRSDDEIAHATQILSDLKKQMNDRPSAELIMALQSWVNEYVDQASWTRFRNLESQRKVSKRQKKKQIPVRQRQYDELETLKLYLGAKNWDEAFQYMIKCTKDSLLNTD